MKCTICGKEYQTYPETKACYDSHPTQEAVEEKMSSPLDALNKLYKQRSEAPKRIEPKKTAIEGEDTVKNYVDRLIGLAKDNEVKGVGKLTLPQIRTEIGDKTLRLEDIRRWFSEYAADIPTEPRIGNTLYIYFNNTAMNKPLNVTPHIPQLDKIKHVNGI